MAGDQVRVSWNAVDADNIERYKVYYSTETILGNNGLYDDFEVTQGPVTSLTIARPNSAKQFYFAVIAVTTDGEESEFFTQEAVARFDGTVQQPVQTSSAPAVQQPISSMPAVQQPVSSEPFPEPPFEEGDAVRLVRADPESSTGVLVIFTSPITVTTEGAPQGLRIVDAQGNQLQITRITISGDHVIIYTMPQKRGVVYRVEFSEPFKGVNGKPLDQTDRNALFTGHETGIDPGTMTSPTGQMREVNPMFPPDVQNLKFTPYTQNDGLYTLIVEWQVDNSPGDLAYYLIYQTRDGGKTFAGPSVLPIDIRGVQLQGVTPGEYGIAVQTINMYGYVSQGVFQNVFLSPLTGGAPRNSFQASLIGTDNTAQVQHINMMDSAEIAQITAPVTAEDGTTQESGVRPVQRQKVNAYNLTVVVLVAAGTLIMALSSFIFVKAKKKHQTAGLLQ